MLALYALGCMANQAMWIGFAPIEAEVMDTFGASSTWVNLLSLVFMIVSFHEGPNGPKAVAIFGSLEMLRDVVDRPGFCASKLGTPGPGVFCMEHWM
jgi:hypothetical protein